LDPSIYGAQESALREEHIEGHLNGMSIQQVMKKQKKKKKKKKKKKRFILTANFTKPS
jgi:hypothetical protein